MASEPSRLVTCAGCGGVFKLSARNVRAARARGEELRCRPCRHPRRLDPERYRLESERYKAWWKARFTDDELLELGQLIGWR